MFIEVDVVYLSYDFGGLRFRREPMSYRDMTPARRANEASWHRGLFKVFRRMYAVRGFQLALCVDVWDGAGEYAKGLVEQAIAVEKAGKGFDYLPSKPSVIYSPRRDY